MKYVIVAIIIVVAGISAYFFIPSSSKNEGSSKLESTQSKMVGKNQKVIEVENSLMSKDMPGFQVRRNGNKLSVISKSGKEFNFDDWESEDGYSYSFNYLVEYRANPEILVVWSENTESAGFTYMLPNGENIPAVYYLHFSPSGNRAIQVKFSDGQFDFNGWTIVQREGDSFKDVATKSPAEFRDFINIGLSFKNWDGEDSIDLIMKYTTTQKAESVTLCVPAKLAFIEGKWRLEAELDGAEQDCSEFDATSLPEHLKALL